MKKDSKNKLAASYAEALYKVSADNRENILADIEKLRQAVKADARILERLSNPLWKAEDKKQTLAEIGRALELNAATVNTLQLVAENGRLNALSEILDAYVRIYYAANNIAEVSVGSAVALTPDQEARLKGALEEKLRKKVVIKYQIKPELLGGLLIECGSMMIDDSVKGKLDRLELLMKGTK